MQMNKKKIWKSIVTIGMILGCLTFTAQVYATDNSEFQMSYNGYSISEYVVDTKINEDCSLDVKESITANFITEKHGIYRTIPIW